MIENIKKRLGILFPILATAAMCISLFFCSRLALVLWQWERIDASHGLWDVLIGGLRIDIASVCYLLILPAFLSCFLLWDNRLGKMWSVILRVWITAGIWFVFYMEAATVPFILEYDLRPNRLFIEYLVYPKEIMSMLWSGYKLELFIGILVSVFAIMLGWKTSRYMLKDLHYPKWYWRPFLALFVLAIGIMGARSTLGHRPMNPALVAFSSDPLMNDLTLNSAYAVLFAAKQMGAEENAFKFYPPLEYSQIIEQVQESMNVKPADFSDDNLPSYAFHEASYQGKPKNIVILLLESHGARYVSELGGLDLSPNLDALMNEGWAFTRLYATGTRSVRGIEALTSGFLPTPSRSTVKLNKSQHNFFTIAHLLKTRGYHTQFVYGGESHFDNMKSFFLGNGFTDIQDLPTFSNPQFVGSWGASDQDLFKHAHKNFERLNKENKPFFSLVFSSSNHSPFEYPDNTIEQYNAPKQTVENAVKYADFALGEFIAAAKKSEYWDNTVFIVIADHDARSYGSQAIPVSHFHIPGIIFGKGIPSKKDPRLTSQLDIPPTLLSLAGISSKNPMVGHDLTQDIPFDKQRAMMQRDRTFAWMNAKYEVVVFQPDKPPFTYLYSPQTDKLEPINVLPDVLLKANAHALWGSLAYKENLYIQKKAY